MKHLGHEQENSNQSGKIKANINEDDWLTKTEVHEHREAELS